MFKVLFQSKFVLVVSGYTELCDFTYYTFHNLNKKQQDGNQLKECSLKRHHSPNFCVQRLLKGFWSVPLCLIESQPIEISHCLTIPFKQASQ